MGLSNLKNLPEEFVAFAENLKAKQKKTRPRKVETFVNAFNAFAKTTYDTKVIDIFIKLGIIEVDESKIIYNI